MNGTVVDSLHAFIRYEQSQGFLVSLYTKQGIRRIDGIDMNKIGCITQVFSDLKRTGKWRGLQKEKQAGGSCLRAVFVSVQGKTSWTEWQRYTVCLWGWGCICFHGNALFNSLVRGALDAAMRLIIPNALRKISSEEACLLGHVLILFCQSNLWIGSVTLSWKCRSSGSLAVGSWFSNFLKPLLWYWKGMKAVSVPERKQTKQEDKTPDRWPSPLPLWLHAHR